MKSIRKQEVPDYLNTSALYESLDYEGEFEVPISCFKLDCDISNAENLKHLLHTARFWCTPTVPIEVFQFMMWNPAKIEYDEIIAEFKEFDEYLTTVLRLKECEQSAMCNAILKAQLGVKVLKLAHRRGCPLSYECCERAAEVGDLESLQYLHNNRCRWTASTTTAAAVHGHLDCLRYAVDSQCRVHKDLSHYIAKSGPVESLKFMHDYHYQIKETALNFAAAGGNLQCLKYLGDTLGLSLPPKLHCLAAGCTEKHPRCDALGCLKYLHHKGLRRPVDDMFGTEYWLAPSIYAARAGNLDCLMYLHETGDTWTDEVSCAAAEHGQLACLRYTNEHGLRPFGAFDTAMVHMRWQCVWYEVRHGHRGALSVCATGALLVTFCACSFYYLLTHLSQEEFAVMGTYVYVVVPCSCFIAMRHKRHNHAH